MKKEGVNENIEDGILGILINLFLGKCVNRIKVFLLSKIDV